MRLIRFGPQGREKLGVLLDGKRRDLSAYFQDWNSVFFAESGLQRLSAAFRTMFPKANSSLSAVDSGAMGRVVTHSTRLGLG